MPVSTFTLLICGVVLAAGLTVAVAFVFSGLVSVVTGGLLAVALLIAAGLVRRAGP